jgi:arylsulfatase A-like enzyme
MSLLLAFAMAMGCRSETKIQETPAPANLPSVSDPGAAAPVSRVETADAWLDLIAQRPSAVQRWGGAVVIDLGTEQARKHLSLTGRGQWRLGEDVEGTRAGRVVGRTASVTIPLDGDLAPALHPAEKGDGDDSTPGLAIAITVRSTVERQRMTVLLNERPLAHLELNSGWNRRTLSLPDDLVRPGDNELRFHFRQLEDGDDQVAAAVSRIEVGTHQRIVEPPETRGGPVYELEPDPAGRARLRLPAGAGMVWYAIPPSRGKLELSARGNGAMTVLVSTDEDHAAGRAPTAVIDEPLRETGRQARVDLSPWGGVPIRIEVQVRGREVGAAAEIDELMVASERTRPVDGRPRRRRDLAIVSVEGLRADALRAGERPALPHLEELARGALRFDRVYTLSPSSVPSHAAWMTSVVPPAHLTVNGTYVADGQTTLAESLGRASYLRTIVSANSDVTEERGLVQGFDRRNVLGGDVDDDSAVAVMRDALGVLEDHASEVMLLANVNDPQAPYEPPRDHVRLVEIPKDAPPPHLTHVWVGRIRLGKHQPTAAELEYVRALYRGEVRVVDDAIGELVDRLRLKGRLESAIIVVFGVHGEEFYEHGSAGHDRTLYEETLRVPLLIHAPDLLPPGRVSTPVDLLDLSPTIVDLLGVPAPDSWQGQSLLEVVDDPNPPPRLLVAYMGDGRRAAIVGDLKYILGPGKTERYFDLAADPGEENNRAASGGIGLRIVRTALAWQLAHERRWRRARWGTGANLAPAFALDQGM